MESTQCTQRRPRRGGPEALNTATNTTTCHGHPRQTRRHQKNPSPKNPVRDCAGASTPGSVRSGPSLLFSYILFLFSFLFSSRRSSHNPPEGRWWCAHVGLLFVLLSLVGLFHDCLPRWSPPCVCFVLVPSQLFWTRTGGAAQASKSRPTRPAPAKRHKHQQCHSQHARATPSPLSPHRNHIFLFLGHQLMAVSHFSHQTASWTLVSPPREWLLRRTSRTAIMIENTTLSTVRPNATS